MAAPGHEIGVSRQRPVGGELGGVDEHGHTAPVGAVDDLVERWEPAGDVGGAGDGEQPGCGAVIERGGDVGGGEGAVLAALDVATPGQPSPRQEVGVVLDDGGDDDVVGSSRSR